ncbi:unnamed protein product [Owenia fusiformis]|uniref:Uncharacterized protein n=1 Tax=Owenia fusiformis TaxID=6347 RepID=A0A8J1T668_OWEFU|nr:unnamed protein product [Owenia fusiformis]
MTEYEMNEETQLTKKHFKGSTSFLDEQEKKDEPIEMNMYTIKKTISQGMLDGALIMANASQLKSLLLGGKHRFYYVLLAMISLSLALQVMTGIVLLYIGKGDINNKKQQESLDRWNNRATAFVFLVTVVNIIISVFNLQGETFPH